MAYLTFDSLTSRTFSKATILNESISDDVENIFVFLSYRREDRKWVDPIVRLLKRVGVSVYIDYLDETLEDIPNSRVAGELRKHIARCKKFVTIATPNATRSKWMPWELGLGDRIVNYDNVAILPLTNYSNTWGDQEYAAIYGRIENLPSIGFESIDTWYVIFPDGTRIGLKKWLLN